MSHAEDISGILSGQGLQDWLDGTRRELITDSDAIRQGATVLRSGLRKYIKNKGGGMMDSYRAGKVVKPLFHAADLMEEAAKMMGTTWALYNGLIIPLEVKKASSDQGTFNPGG